MPRQTNNDMEEDLMGYDKDPNRATVNVAFRKLPTKDSGPHDDCRNCGELVRFTTNGSGGHMAVHRDSLEPHRCMNP